MNILIMGPAGAGKGTMSDLIIKHYDIPHISTGDMLRENVKNNTELGQQAKAYMNTGKLVPDELINAMVEKRLLEDSLTVWQENQLCSTFSGKRPGSVLRIL